MIHAAQGLGPAYGLCTGAWWATGVLLNQLLAAEGFHGSATFVAGAILQFAAVVSMWGMGKLLDRTHACVIAPTLLALLLLSGPDTFWAHRARYKLLILLSLLGGAALLLCLAGYLVLATQPRIMVLAGMFMLVGLMVTGAQPALYVRAC